MSASTPTAPGLSALLRSRRESLGLKGYEVAARAHVSPSGLDLIERGLRPNPGIKTVAKLARALRLSGAEILSSIES